MCALIHRKTNARMMMTLATNFSQLATLDLRNDVIFKHVSQADVVTLIAYKNKQQKQDKIRRYTASDSRFTYNKR